MLLAQPLGLVLLHASGSAVPPMARSRAPLATAADTDAGMEMALFDPKTDAIPFPFPAPGPSLAMEDDEVAAPSPPCRYAFDRPLYLRMCKDVQEIEGARFVGHCGALSPRYPCARLS
jgi:hypothetical protein